MSKFRAFAGVVLVVVTARTASAQVAPFTEEAIARGLDYPMPPSLSGLLGFGAGFADLDADGDLDIVALGRESGVVGIFENDGGGYFADRSAICGIPVISAVSNFAAADWDADGDLDLIITRIGYAPFMFRNDGAIQFTDVSAATGVATPSITKGVAWGDVDSDGWIDLYITHHAMGLPGTTLTRNQLWHNNGDGTFTNVAAALGIDTKTLCFMGVLFDADDDGDLDIYLSNDRGMASPPYQPNRFWRNDAGVLVEIGQQNGTGLGFFSMGVAVGDADGDDLTDLYVTNSPNTAPPLFGANPLFLRQSTGSYLLDQAAWGIAHFAVSWACFFFDVNQDRLLDLYVVNGAGPGALYVKGPTLPMTDQTVAAGLSDVGPFGYCASVGDVDGDGDQDLLTNNFGGNIHLYINQTNDSAHWAKFKVVGEQHDLQALGAVVRVTTADETQLRHVLIGGNGYLGQNDLDCHFGLGELTLMDSIEVRWPNTGSVRTLTSYSADSRWTLYPPARMGDFNGDGVVNQLDLSVLSINCAAPVVPGLEMLDIVSDGWLDSLDAAAMVAIISGPIGDLDGNGAVNGADLGILLSQWGSLHSPSDLNANGVVNGADLGLLLSHWSG